MNSFQGNGLIFVCLHVNNILPKIDEICFIAKKPYALVIGISESKLDFLILNSEVKNNGYFITRLHDSVKRGGV